MLHAGKLHMSVLNCSIRLTACSIQSIQFLFHVVIFSWDMAEEALIGFIVLEVLEDDEKRLIVRGETRKWMKRRQKQGLYNNLVKELWLEDTRFVYSLSNISQSEGLSSSESIKSVVFLWFHFFILVEVFLFFNVFSLSVDGESWDSQEAPKAYPSSMMNKKI